MATLLHAFYRQRRGRDLDVVALPDLTLEATLAAVAGGAVDVTFRGLTDPRRQLSGTGLSSALVIEDRHELLVGPKHPLADAPSVIPRQLAEHPIWMPGLPSGDEVAAYYAELGATFGITIDVLGPAFGAEVLMTEIAESATLANLVGEGSRYLWPAHYDLRRIPIVDPTPVFPLWVIWRTDNRHSDLAELLAFLKADFAGPTRWRQVAPVLGTPQPLVTAAATQRELPDGVERRLRPQRRCRQPAAIQDAQTGSTGPNARSWLPFMSRGGRGRG